MVQLAGMLKAVVTGKQYDGGGDNEKVDLKGGAGQETLAGVRR